MSSITVGLTDKQAEFLRLFAKNHHPGADDNLGTDIPIHIVQTKGIEYFPTNECYASCEPDGVVFSAPDITGGVRYKTPGEMVGAYRGKQTEVDPTAPMEILDYTDALGKCVRGADGAEHYIYSVYSYFEAYKPEFDERKRHRNSLQNLLKCF